MKSSNGSSAYETATGRLIAKGKQTAAFDKEIAVSSPRARFAAVFSGEGPSARVRVSDTATQRLLGEVPSDWDVVEAQVDIVGASSSCMGIASTDADMGSVAIEEFARFSDNTVQRVFFSPPDGSCFATIGRLVASSVRLWRTTDGEVVTAIQRKSKPESVPRGVALDPSGEFLVIPGTPGTRLAVCTVESGRKLATLPHRGIERVALSHRNECIVTAGDEDGYGFGTFGGRMAKLAAWRSPWP